MSHTNLYSYLSRNSNKITASYVQNFFVLDKMQRTSKGSDLSDKKKNGVTVHLRELSTSTDTKIPTTTLSVHISYSARALT